MTARSGSPPSRASPASGPERWGATPSDVASDLREARARLIADASLGGSAFGVACSRLFDGTLRTLFEAAPRTGSVALVALGSYARRELCPGSDIDLLLVHDGSGAINETADAIWYPLWDAGLIVGHATRTIREALGLADADLEALTSMLDVRIVAGDERLVDDLVRRVRRLTERRRGRIVEELAVASDERRSAPIADLLEPNLKDGGGGLRDVQALEWGGWTLGEPGGIDALRRGGYLHPGDEERLATARELLLAVRVALHRVTGGKNDDLRLQDQDAVAAWVGRGDADELARRLAGAARSVAWIASDVWQRLRATRRGPLGRLGNRDRDLAPGVVLRDGRATIRADAPLDGAMAVRLAAAAAEHDVPMDRQALARLGEHAGTPGWMPSWDERARTDFIRLLRRGRRAISVIESLAQTGLWAELLPEWEHVRSLPQRNAYHRFTVDRHLLEAVAECVDLLEGDDGALSGVDADVVGHLARPDLLVLGALLHDIGKGLPGDHSDEGAELATRVCRRIGLDEEATGRVATLVRHHLLLADVATRRDLSEEATVAGVARLVGDVPTLDLLYLLTIGDSRATGSAAWGPVKWALVRELFVKASNLLERGEVATGVGEERRRELAALVGEDRADEYLDAMPPSYAGSFAAEQMARHRELLDAGEPVVDWGTGIEERPVVTVAAPDRPGMLSAVAGVLSSHGLNVQEAIVHTRADGRGLEVIRIHDQYGRLAREGGRENVASDLVAALRGNVDVTAKVEERAQRYAGVKRRTKPPTPPQVVVDQESSDFATVIEVHADDRIGLLFRITQVLSDFGLDVHLAKVSTIGDRIVDTFYVREATGGKLRDASEIDRLRHTLLGRLQRS